MPEHFWAMLVAAAIVGMSKGGLASAGTVAVPILAFWMDPVTAASLLLPVYLISDVVGVWLYRREFSKLNVAILVPAGLLGVLIASVMVTSVPTWLIVIATGVIGLVHCTVTWMARFGDGKSNPPSLRRGIPFGMLTGITSFVSHSGSPPFQAYMVPQRLPKMVYAGTSTLVFAAINLFKLPAYYSLGLFAKINVALTVYLCIAAVAGAFVGRRIAMAMPEKIFRQMLQVLLFILSIQLIWRGVAEAVAAFGQV